MGTTFSWAPFWIQWALSVRMIPSWEDFAVSFAHPATSSVWTEQHFCFCWETWIKQTMRAMEQTSLLLIPIKILQYCPQFLYLKQSLPAPSRGAFPAWATKHLPASRELAITPQSCSEHFTGGGGKSNRHEEKAHVCHSDEWVTLWEGPALSWPTITSLSQVCWEEMISARSQRNLGADRTGQDAPI